MKDFLLSLVIFSAVGVAAAVPDADGFLRDWMLLGPIVTTADPGEARGDRLAAEETLPRPGEASDLAGVTWRKLLSPTAVIDLKQLCAPDSDDRTVYLAAEIDTPQPFRGWIGVGSDDCEKVWFNGRAVLESNRKRATVPDEDRAVIDFPAGRSRFLVRVRNFDGGFDFCFRVVNTPEIAARQSSSRQLKTADFNPKLAITDQVYDYLMTRPAQERSGKPVVPQGIIAFTSRRDRWKGFFELLPVRPDFLEIRSEMTLSHRPDFSFHPRELDRTIDAALAAGVEKLQISPVFAATLAGFMDAAYGPGQVAWMTGHDGEMLDRAFETTVFFSYCDPKAQAVMERIIRDTVGHYREDPRGRHIIGWNFKAMTNSDWLYPASKGFFDYSAPALYAYRAFLKERHVTIDRLNAAYGTDFPDFGAVEMPQPPFDRLDLSLRWREFQEFRRRQPTAAVERTRKLIRELDPSRRIISWYTTAMWAASRDTVILDDAIEIARANPNQLTSLTCFDYLNPAAEIWGQLAHHNGVRINVEPVFNTAKSYLQTFFNCLRFPVGQVNWLYVLPQCDPRERPWVVWVLSRGALLDEAAKAELIQNPVAGLFGYSDPFLSVGRELWSDRVEPMRALLRASELGNLQLGWLTDYSDRIDLAKFHSIVIPETRVLRPGMIERLAKFFDDGGTLLLFGEVAKFDLNTGRADWPLRRALGRAAEPSGSAEEWRFGRGRVIAPGKSVRELLNGDRLSGELAALFAELGARPVITATPAGVGAFLKRGKGAYYAGLINIAGTVWRGKVTIPALPAGEYRAVDLVDGTPVKVKERSFVTEFDFADQIRFVKLVPADSSIVLPVVEKPEQFQFGRVTLPGGKTVLLAGEESGDRWIPAGPATVRPEVTPVYPDRAEEERFFQFDFPARIGGEAGAAYVPFDLDHALRIGVTKLAFRLRSGQPGVIELVLPERNWKKKAVCRVAFPGENRWQAFELDLERDFQLSENELTLQELRPEVLVYSDRSAAAAPAVSFELADVRLE